MTANRICVTCGVQYAGTPNHCPICEDERQYVGWNGQQWTTLEAMRGTHRNHLEQQEDGVWSIRTNPAFGIAQRAFLVGDLLWDCVTLLDEETVERVMQIGGISRIAISHPHYYATMAEWSRQFGDVPVYIHASSGKFMGESERQRVVWLRNRRNFRQVESKDLCWSSPP